MFDFVTTFEQTERTPDFCRGRFLAFIWLVVASLIVVGPGEWAEAQESKAETLSWSLALASGEEVQVADWSIVDGQIHTQVADRPTMFSFEQVLKLSRPHRPNAHAAYLLDVRLTDGSELHCNELISQDREIRVALACQQSTSFRRNDLVWFRKVDALGNRLHEAEWNGRLENPSSVNDALGVLRDEQWRWVEGRLGAIERDQVEFAVEDKSAFVKRDRFEGVMFAATDALTTSSRVASVLLGDGSRFNAAKLHTQGQGLVIENLHGARFEFTREVVNEIDFSNDRWVWLSDLKPTTVDWQPLFASENIAEKLRALSMPRFNQSFNGQPLQLNFANPTELSDSMETRTFAHGIAMRGGSRVAFSLAKQYRRLQAVMGFEPLLMVGSVRVKIFGDGRSLFDQVLTAKSDAAPVEVDLEIDGVERLLIEVDYQDGRATGDLIHLCDPKVSK